MFKLASSILGAAALVAVMAGAAACSSNDAKLAGAGTLDAGHQTPPAIAPNPCSLLTDAQAATLFGSPVSHVSGGSRDASNGSGVTVTENRCEYDEVTSSQLGYDLWVAVYAGADQAYFNDARAHSPTISGLGDGAFGDPIHVYVISKGVVLQIYGSLPGTDGLRQAAKIAVASL